MGNCHEIFFPHLIKNFLGTSPYPRGLRSPLEEELTGHNALVELPSLDEFEELSILIGHFSSSAIREKLSENMKDEVKSSSRKKG